MSQFGVIDAIQVRENNGVKVLDVHGGMAFGGPALAELPKKIRELATPGVKLLLNCADAGRTDSATLGEFVSAVVAAKAKGASFAICAPSKYLTSKLQVTNLASVVPSSATEAEGVARLQDALPAGATQVTASQPAA